MPGNFMRWTPRECAYLQFIADEQAQENGQLFDVARYTSTVSRMTDLSMFNDEPEVLLSENNDLTGEFWRFILDDSVLVK